jgi:hypothetical protein
MAASILVRGFHVPLSDNRCIDISADVDADRVVSRLGFVTPGSSPAVVIYAARELNPAFPGILTLPSGISAAPCAARSNRDAPDVA